MEMAQKFWEAVAKASGGNTAAVKETTDRKAEQSPESRESGAARDDHEKPA
jgi:hypothetical protein